MFKIKIPQLNKTITADPHQTLMSTLLRHEVPVASSCNGDGICGKCVLQVKSEQEVPDTELAQKLRHKHQWQPSQKASCQVVVDHDITVHSTYW